MMPLWVRNKEGKWEIFPYHLLDTFENGKQGFTFDANYAYRDEKLKAFIKFRDHFEPHPMENREAAPLLRFRYYLKGKS